MLHTSKNTLNKRALPAVGGVLAMLLLVLFAIASTMANTAGAAAGTLKDEVTRDEVRIAALEIDEIVDGTGPWDGDNSPGNDSADNNKIVRSYDTVVYALHYTTEAATLGDLYKHGWIYCEATLPVSPDVATFNVNAIERDYPDEYDGPRDVVYENGVQKLVWFKERQETKNDKGEIVEPLPNEATFPVTVDVLAATNNTEIKPTFKLSVAYFDEDDNGALKTEGTYDVPKEVTADPVKVSAAPKYNVKIEHSQDSETYNGKIDYWDFSTGNDSSAEYPALYKDKGSVYGKMISMGITLQLYNDDPSKGMKGLEIPTGPIEFDLNMDATFAGNTVDAPLVWSYGPQIDGKSAQQDGREVNAHVTTGLDYAVFEAPRNENSSAAWRDEHPDAASPTSGDNGTNNCWDGGTWHMSASGNKVHVTVEDYNINMNWFPNGDLGHANTNATYFNYLNGVQNIGCFSAGQVFLIVPFGGEPGTPEYYPNKYNADGNVMLNITDDGFTAKSISGQQVNNTAQMATNDDLINSNILLTRPGNRVNRVYYQNLDGYGTYNERGINGAYSTFLEGSDVATLGQEISTCWGIIINPNGSASQSAYAQNALLKFDPTVMEPTGEFTANGPFTSTRQPEPGQTTFLYGFKPDGSAWSSVDEMDEATEQDLVFYSSPTAGPGTCVAILAEAREYPPTAQQERITFSAKFKVKEDFDLVGRTYPLTSGSYVWTKAEVQENGGSIPTRANGASYAVTVEPSYESYYSSTKIRENGEDVNFRKAYYDDQGYHGENGNYIYGDTLYIVGYTTKIQKNVEQANGPNTPKPVVSYSLSKGQSIVDYVLKPDFEIPSVSGADFSSRTTTLTVSDTLPAGVTYRAGSAYLGGEWQENTEFPNRSDKAYLHGNIEGGTQREPDSITYNEDGTTTLTWEFPNTPIETLDTDMWIHFSANLPQAISKTTSYVNTAVVSSTEDRRKQESGNGNLDTATIQVAPASDLVCTKQVDEPLVDTDSPIGFKLRWNNTAPAGSFDNVMMDTMPSTTKNGSEFHGTYVVEGPITIMPPPGKTNANYKFYYTTDAAASDQQASDYQADYKDGKFTGNTVSLQGVTWNKAEISSSNEVADVAGKPITAFVILGKIDKLEELSAHVTIQPTENEFNDVYVNMLSSNLSTTTIEARVVDRVISGKVWVDNNLNGSSEEADEPLVKGVRVELLIMNPDTGAYEPVVDKQGNPRYTLTDENGYYEFNHLKAGTYRVNFTNGNTSIKSYVSTIQNAEGVPEAFNSQATPVYENHIFGFIEGIVLPTAKEMNSSPYRVPYQDLGLYSSAIKDYNNTEGAPKQFSDGNSVQVGDVIPYKITFTSVTTEVQDITFTDTFSKGLKFNDDAVLTSKDENGNDIELTLEKVGEEAGADGALTVTWEIKDVPAKASGVVTYSAEVTDEALDPAKVQNSAQVQFSKSGSYTSIGSLANPLPHKRYKAGTTGENGATVNGGDAIDYEVFMPQVKAEPMKVVVKDTMSKGLNYEPNTAAMQDGTKPDSEEITNNSNGSTTITWTFDALPEGEWVLSYAGTVEKPATIDLVTNSVTIAYGEGGPTTLEELQNPVNPPAPEVPEEEATPDTGDPLPLLPLALLALGALGLRAFRRA